MMPGLTWLAACCPLQKEQARLCTGALTFALAGQGLSLLLCQRDDLGDDLKVIVRVHMVGSGQRSVCLKSGFL